MAQQRRSTDSGSGLGVRLASELPEPDGAEQLSAAEQELRNNIAADEQDSELPSSPECPVCLQPCINEVRLPCSHVFCYLCVKGVMGHGRRSCSLCRADVPLSFLITPTLVDGVESSTEAIDGQHMWFYEGRRGWWQYEKRAAAELEEKYLAGAKSFELMISGFAYVIDLDEGVQYRRQHPTRRRRIKRDIVDIPDKCGVAGIVCRPLLRGAEPSSRSGGDGGEEKEVQPAGTSAMGNSTTNRASALGNSIANQRRETVGDTMDNRNTRASNPNRGYSSRGTDNVSIASPRSNSSPAGGASAATNRITSAAASAADNVTLAASATEPNDQDSLTERLGFLTVDEPLEREDTSDGNVAEESENSQGRKRDIAFDSRGNETSRNERGAV